MATFFSRVIGNRVLRARFARTVVCYCVPSIKFLADYRPPRDRTASFISRLLCGVYLVYYHYAAGIIGTPLAHKDHGIHYPPLPPRSNVILRATPPPSTSDRYTHTCYHIITWARAPTHPHTHTPNTMPHPTHTILSKTLPYHITSYARTPRHPTPCFRKQHPTHTILLQTNPLPYFRTTHPTHTIYCRRHTHVPYLR